MNGIIYLEDGTVYCGKGFGALGTTVGEIVFNTSMIGYQEVLEDPSNAGYIVNMTYPWIGNYGIKKSDLEQSVHTKGLIVKTVNNNPSNYKSIKTLQEYMEEKNIVGVSDVDTRAITKKIRKIGSVKCVISNENKTVDELENIIKETIEYDYIKKCSVSEIEKTEGTDLNIGVLDLGDKSKVIKALTEKKCGMTVFPYNSSIEEIEKANIDGLIITNGPGLLENHSSLVDTVKKIASVYPTFGISLGHQFLAKAFGAEIVKMKYGHRGSNHAVYDYNKERAYIVPQNHGFVVDKESLKSTDLEITHKNLNDDTVEGLRHKELKVSSIQFDLELESDLENTSYLLNDFIDTLKEDK